MSERGWKKFERRLATMLGTQRIPVTGERNGADAETPMFAFQFKKRATVPQYLSDWLDGISAARPTKVGVVVMQRPRRPDVEALVVMSLKDFLDLHGSQQCVDTPLGTGASNPVGGAMPGVLPRDELHRHPKESQ